MGVPKQAQKSARQSTNDSKWLSARNGQAVVLDLWVVPGSSQNRIIGLHAGALKVQVAAPASEGQANRAAISLLARVLGIKERSVCLEQGQTSRRKSLRIECESENHARNIAEKLLLLV